MLDLPFAMALRASSELVNLSIPALFDVSQIKHLRTSKTRKFEYIHKLSG